MGGIKCSEAEIPDSEQLSARERARAHWLLALGELEEANRKPCLLLVAGLPDSGKSTLARGLAGRAFFHVLRSDVVRKPGAFMNRSVLESDPHRVLEGMAIAGYALGASQGYIYVRGEYPLAIERLQTAL